jgi:hypothetical protein
MPRKPTNTLKNEEEEACPIKFGGIGLLVIGG